MRRREFLIGAAAALASSKAMARSRAALLGKSWVLPGAAIDLDFANNRAFGGALSSLLSCSRASSGYATNSGGTLISFPANTLRIGSGTGLLDEEARTNLLLRSQDIGSAPWVVGGAVRVTDIIAAPDGTITADSINESSSGAGVCDVGQLISGGTTSGANYAISAYMKAGSLPYGYVAICSNATGNHYVTVVFDLVNGIANTQNLLGSSSGTLVSSKIESLANGWFRCSIVASINVTDGFLFAGSAPAATGNAAPGGFGEINYSRTSASQVLYLWGAQIEQAAFPTSYIPTTAAAVTRAGDFTTSLSAVLNSLGQKGFIYAQYTPLYDPAVAQSARDYVWYVTDSGLSRLAHRTGDTGASSPNIVVGDGVSNVNLFDINGSKAATKTVAAWNASSTRFCLNGRTPISNAKVWNPSPQTFGLGGSLNGTIQRFAYGPVDLSSAAMQALAT